MDVGTTGAGNGTGTGSVSPGSGVCCVGGA